MTSTVNYAGDVSVIDTWNILRDDAGAILVDVRTQAELLFIGSPDLSSLGKSVVNIEWQGYPSMEVNVNFLDQLNVTLGHVKDQSIFFLCRSGARSLSAAMTACSHGFMKAYNVACGFEGDLDEVRQRGKTNGWKAQGLPWVQG